MLSSHKNRKSTQKKLHLWLVSFSVFFLTSLPLLPFLISVALLSTLVFFPSSVLDTFYSLLMNSLCIQFYLHGFASLLL